MVRQILAGHWHEAQTFLYAGNAVLAELLQLIKSVSGQGDNGGGPLNPEDECEWLTGHAWTPSTDANVVEIVVEEYGPCCELTADVYVYGGDELILWEVYHCPETEGTHSKLLYRGPAEDYRLNYTADCECFVMISAIVIAHTQDDGGSPISEELGVALCNTVCGTVPCNHN